MEVKPFSIENFVRRRAGHVLVTYKNNLYMWGGYMEEPHEGTYNLMTQSSTHFHNAHEIWIYSSLLNIWTRKTCVGDIPLQLSGASAGVIDNFMYLFGGFNGDEPFEGSKNILWRLDLDAYVWKLVNPSGNPPFPCDKSASWVYHNRLYIFGGFGPYLQQNILAPNFVNFETEEGLQIKGWMDQLVYYDESSNSWVWPNTKGTKPSPRAAHAAAVLKNKAFIFGGRHKEHRLNDFYSLDLDKLKWNQVPHQEGNPIPIGRSWHTLNAVSDHQLMLYGGFSTSCQVLNDAWIYNALTLTWRPLPSDSFSTRLWHCGAKTERSEIIYIGGINDCWLIEVRDDMVDPIEKAWEEIYLAYDHGEPRCNHCSATIPEGQVSIVSGLTQPYYLTMYLLIEHAEDMLIIRLSPPSLFEMTLDYVSKNPKIFPKKLWSLLPHHVTRILEIRTDPFEIHGIY